jgi:two-component system, chemotaxis family, sensor kinase CheA
MNELLKDFLTESAEQLEAINAQLVRFEQDPSDARIIANIFRLVHAIKGTCGFLNLPRLEKVAHSAETLIDRLRDGAPPDSEMVALVLATVDRIKFLLAALAQGRGEPSGDDEPLIANLRKAAEFARAPRRFLAPAAPAWEAGFGPGPTPPERRIDTVRISVQTLERMTSLVSELVLTRNQLIEVARASVGDKMLTPLQRLSAVTADLQAGVLAARMLPIERLFGNFHRLVRDLATDLGKKAELVLLGGGTELDRQLIEAIRDPLAHMIRNAVDHGIETPEERLRLGKPEVGVVQVSASQKAGIVTIEVADDGRGLDVVSIRDRALALGLGSREELAALSETEICRFVFAPGFTTVTHMNRISGRGVGLDIVRGNIEQIGGSVNLICGSGRGAVISLRIPLTLAILPAFIVTAGSERFALPQHCVDEIIELDAVGKSPLLYVQGAPVLNIAEGPLPVANLSDLIRSRTEPPAPGSPPGLVLKMRAGVHAFAIIVDEIVDLQEIVLKPLPAPLLQLPLFSAGAILGDGSVVLVLDAAGLAAAIGLPKSSAPQIAPPAEAKTPPARTKVVIFRSGGPALRALPVSAVVRIQRLGPGQVEFADGAFVVRIDGRLIALVRLDRARLVDLSQKSLTALILQLGEERLAVAVDEIVDVVEEEIGGELPGLSHGVLRVAILRGEATEILDPSSFFDPRVRRLERPTDKPAQARVLIVESTGFFRNMIAAALTRSGFGVSAVSDGAEALLAIGRSTPFAAALVDIDLAAVRNGELAREIRAAALSDAPALIGLATHGGRLSQAKARRAGLFSAVGKFDRTGMISAIRSSGADEMTGIAA